jgi:hypothetical protein
VSGYHRGSTQEALGHKDLATTVEYIAGLLLSVMSTADVVEQDWPPEVMPALILMAGNLIEEAATQGLRIAHMRLEILERLSARDLPDLPDIIQNVLSVGAEAPIETVTLQRDQVIDSVRSQQRSPRIKLRLRDSQRFPDELDGLEFNMQGILKNEGSTSVLRLTTDQITPDDYSLGIGRVPCGNNY